MKIMSPIFKIKMVIYQSKADLDVKILLGNIIHFIDPKIMKMMERGLYGNQDSTFHSMIHILPAIEDKIIFLKPTKALNLTSSAT